MRIVHGFGRLWRGEIALGWTFWLAYVVPLWVLAALPQILFPWNADTPELGLRLRSLTPALWAVVMFLPLWRSAARYGGSGTVRVIALGFAILWGGTGVAAAIRVPVEIRAEQVAWRQAVAANDTAAYRAYTREFPHGRFARDAEAAVEAIAWQQAETTATGSAYREFLAAHPEGRFSTEARTREDSLAWAEARTVNNAVAYQTYLRDHPAGRFVADADTLGDALAWAEAGRTNSADAYLAYLRAYPSGRSAAEARGRGDRLAWTAAERQGRAEGFRDYLRDFPSGAHAAEAATRAHEAAWREAESANTAAGYRTYLAAYPSGVFAIEAAARIERVVWHEARQEGTRDAIQRFLANYPTHARAGEARLLLERWEPRPLAELVAAGRVVARARGAGIGDMRLSIRTAVGEPQVMHVPAGTFFASRDAAVQNMVAVQDVGERVLPDSGWMDLWVRVACANRRLRVPDSETAFTVRAQAPGRELQALVPHLVNSSSPRVTQAAVWIVTDDANFADLGSLVRRQFGITLGRAITETDAAQAMQICRTAGVDLRTKRIWADRSTIAPSVTDSALRAWLLETP